MSKRPFNALRCDRPFLEKLRVRTADVASDIGGLRDRCHGISGPTWDMPCQLQADLFQEIARISGLAVQLVFYRAHKCTASRWGLGWAHARWLDGKNRLPHRLIKLAKVLSHARKGKTTTRLTKAPLPIRSGLSQTARRAPAGRRCVCGWWTLVD